MPLRAGACSDGLLLADPNPMLMQEPPPSDTPDDDALPLAREFAHHLEQMSLADILAALVQVPIYTWNYEWDDPSIRHMGPMAQDFYAAFGLGEGDTTIFHVDGMGVCMAALQALHSMVQEQAQQIEQQQALLEEQATTIAALERLVPQSDA